MNTIRKQSEGQGTERELSHWYINTWFDEYGETLTTCKNHYFRNLGMAMRFFEKLVAILWQNFLYRYTPMYVVGWVPLFVEIYETSLFGVISAHDFYMYRR